jgi:flagellar basal body-associated protein FliL
MELVAMLLTGAFALTFVAFSNQPKKSKKAKAQPVRIRANYTREYELRRRGLIR